MSSSINIYMIKRDILKLYNDILKNLKGDWLIVGGALLHVLGISDRETLDIDLAPLEEVTNKDQLFIMEIAVKNGFPPETINFSAEYFVKKQKNWRSELVLISETRNGRMYRPSRRLFRQLKEQRGTETDLLDIQIFEENVNE